MDPPKLAGDIMVTKLVTLTPWTNVFDGIGRLLKHNVTGAPVIDEQRNYLGIFSEKCCMKILTATARTASTRTVRSHNLPRAKDVMATKLFTLSPEMDVFEAIGLLLKHRASGAPVIDEQRQFLGSFSEKTSMTVLLDAAYDQLPTSRVEAFMDRDQDRIITEEKDLLSMARVFLDTPYRRLVVLRDGAVVGQVSRRDVLRVAYSFSDDSALRQAGLRDWSAEERGESRPKNEQVATFMDTSAKTVSEEVDLLAIAQIFRQTPYRRLPVLRQQNLVGQISRRDVLKATNDMIAVSAPREKTLLYLSALITRQDAPIK